MGHEQEMAVVADAIGVGLNDEEVRDNRMALFDSWAYVYAPHLLVALNDTMGTDSFFRDFGKERAEIWDGYRPDSGDFIEEGEKQIKFLESHGIDPKTKTIFFADSMDTEKIIKARNHFCGRSKYVFGPGTFSSNNVGLPVLSLVMKLVAVKDQGTVQLTNNLAKSTGEREDIGRIKKIFGYTGTFHEECRY